MSIEPTSTYSYTCVAAASGYEIAATEAPLPPCRLMVCGGESAFVESPTLLLGVLYAEEGSRGYPKVGQLWTPGAFNVELHGDKTVALVGSTEDWQQIESSSPSLALAAEQSRRDALLAQADRTGQDGVAAELVLAADQFIIRAVGRAEHGMDADSREITARTVIAGYHWFTDWGRDTMISLEGLTVATARFAEARQILLTFANYVRDGLIPNLFPDGEEEGLYHTADATLWFFHAIGRYMRATNDVATLQQLLPTLIEIAEAHLRGTKFNIHVDAADGLLVQGAEGYQLTWMDAKMGDWVVTPRRGKAVEINALWFNALQLLAGWLRDVGRNEDAEQYESHARRAYDAFHRRFWFEEGRYLYDVIDTVDGDDTSCRPNQIFAISLDHPVLAPERWAPVLATVERELLTPFGLRTLAAAHPDYKPSYVGDLRSRDGAYHQGTVWAWLIGPFIDAWQKVHPGQRREARKFLAHFQSTSAMRGSARSAKSSTPTLRTPRAAASRKHGAWRKSYAAGSPLPKIDCW